VESHVRVPIALESVYEDQQLPPSLGYPLRGLGSPETRARRAPTMVQPLHQLGLGSLCYQHSRTGTSPAERAIPCVRLQESPRRAQGLAIVASKSAHPRHRINPASALRASPTYSNRHASNAPATTGAPTSHRARRDRRVAPEYQGQDHSINHTAAVASYRARHAASAHTTHHIATACTALVLSFNYKRGRLGPFLGKGETPDEHTHTLTETSLR